MSRSGPHGILDTMIIHILASMGDLEIPVTPLRMLCGARGVYDEDGWIKPDDMDFVDPPDRRCICDCGPCLDIAALIHVDKKIMVDV
jgi:hypothetical protein